MSREDEMGTQIVEGRNSLTHTVGKNPARLIKEEMMADGKPAVQTDEETENLTVQGQRTISLKNYEFARVALGIKVGLPGDPTDEDRDAAYKRMRDAIEEVLDREEAFIRGEDREFNPVDLNGVGVKVAIWLDYGGTFKKKGMDSNKVDVSASRRLSDGSDFEEQLEVLVKEVGKRFGEYKGMILGTDGNVGF